MRNVPWKNLIRPILVLVLIVIGCAAAARFLSGDETLAEYAEKNPAAAYGQTTEAADEDVETEENAAGAASGGVGIPAPSGAERASDADAADGETRTDANRADAADGETRNHAVGTNVTSGETDADSAEDLSAALTDDSDVADARVTYADGFFYEPVPAAVFRRMVGNSYPEDCPLALDELRYLNVCYVDFNDAEQRGEIVCNQAIAGDLTEIFHDLFEARYQLESVRLIDDYGGDDDASMLDNNTSCFNYRTVAGSTSLSNHARGLAIDVNPFYNPWVNHGKVSPPEAAAYADRSRDFPHKIDKDDFCCQCFINHGFFWGGNWNNPDYQHFQKN